MCRKEKESNIIAVEIRPESPASEAAMANTIIATKPGFSEEMPFRWTAERKPNGNAKKKKKYLREIHLATVGDPSVARR